MTTMQEINALAKAAALALAAAEPVCPKCGAVERWFGDLGLRVCKSCAARYRVNAGNNTAKVCK